MAKRPQTKPETKPETETKPEDQAETKTEAKPEAKPASGKLVDVWLKPGQTMAGPDGVQRGGAAGSKISVPEKVAKDLISNRYAEPYEQQDAKKSGGAEG